MSHSKASTIAARWPTDTRTRLAVTLDAAIRGSRWALALRADELTQVVSESFECAVPQGDYVARCGDPAEFWFGVIDGIVKMSVSHRDGRTSTFTGVTAGGWGGEGSLLKGERWRYDVVAARNTRLACVPRHVFERLVERAGLLRVEFGGVTVLDLQGLRVYESDTMPWSARPRARRGAAAR